MPSIYGIDQKTEEKLLLAIKERDADLLKDIAVKNGNIGSVTCDLPEEVKSWIIKILAEEMTPWNRSLVSSAVNWG